VIGALLLIGAISAGVEALNRRRPGLGTGIAVTVGIAWLLAGIVMGIVAPKTVYDPDLDEEVYCPGPPQAIC
jgi:hypothetical protein